MSKLWKVFAVANELDTQIAASEIAKIIEPGMLIGLSGELGAGKTTLVRYLLKALESSDQVSSPSYVLQHIYTAKNSLQIEHWDLYRLSALPSELLEGASANRIILVEWADKFPELQCELGMTIKIIIGALPEARSIEVCKT